jgi:hypothetical protein
MPAFALILAKESPVGYNLVCIGVTTNFPFCLPLSAGGTAFGHQQAHAHQPLAGHGLSGVQRSESKRRNTMPATSKLAAAALGLSLALGGAAFAQSNSSSTTTEKPDGQKSSSTTTSDPSKQTNTTAASNPNGQSSTTSTTQHNDGTKTTTKTDKT